LIEHQPRSPIGSLILTALGGILLAVNLRGETSPALIVGRYWFWFLVAFVSGRVLWQYTHRNAYGKAPRALSPGALFVMILIATTGLSANYLNNNGQLLSRVNSRISEIGGVSDYVFGNPIKVEDEAPQSFKLPPNARLIVNSFNGDIEILSSPTSQATAKLIKFVRATNEERAREAAKSIHLQISLGGNNVQLGLASDNPSESFTAALLVEVPAQHTVNLEVNDPAGAVTISDLRGDLALRNCARVIASHNRGRLSLEGARGLVKLSQHEGEVVLANLRSGAELNEIKGQVTLNGQGSNYRLNKLAGGLRVTAEDGSVSVTDLKGAAQIEATRDITVQNFVGPLNVKTRTGRLTLSHNSELGGDLVAINEHGQTRVVLPADIAFRLDASTSSGHLRVRGFEDLNLTRNQRALTNNYHADGNAPLVSLRSTSGNIELQSSGPALASNDEQ
jgi:hypothetical protein